MSGINIPENYNDFAQAVQTLVRIGKQITDRKIANRDGVMWSYTDQIARMHEEVSEVYREMRQKEPKRELMCQEIIDVFCATITLMNMQNVTNEEIDNSVKYVLEKLYYRNKILH